MGINGIVRKKIGSRSLDGMFYSTVCRTTPQFKDKRDFKTVLYKLGATRVVKLLIQRDKKRRKFSVIKVLFQFVVEGGDSYCPTSSIFGQNFRR